MIPLSRTRDNTINVQFRGDKLRESSLALLTAHRMLLNGEIEKHEFDSNLWKKAKDQLLAETHDKCAYCETPTAVNSYGDVEHYRPKSIYWWLAYCLENYLVSCAICNQRFKSDNFPKQGRKLRAPRIRSNSSDATLLTMAKNVVPDPLDAAAVGAFDHLQAAEVALLVNPYFDNPADYYAWRADMTIEEVELVPAPDNPLAESYANAAREFYGLDRAELRRQRFFTFESYLTTKMTLAEPGLSALARQRNQSMLERMLRDEYPYSGMIRFFENRGNWEDWIVEGYLVLPTP